MILSPPKISSLKSSFGVESVSVLPAPSSLISALTVKLVSINPASTARNNGIICISPSTIPPFGKSAAVKTITTVLSLICVQPFALAVLKDMPAGMFAVISIESAVTFPWLKIVTFVSTSSPALIPVACPGAVVIVKAKSKSFGITVNGTLSWSSSVSFVLSGVESKSSGPSTLPTSLND